MQYFPKTYGFRRVYVHALQDQSTKPFKTSGYKGESAGATSSHATYFDTPRYTTKNQPPRLNKGLVKGTGRTMVFSRLPSPTELLLPMVRGRPQKTKKKRRKHKMENIASQGCRPFRRSSSNQYLIIGGISKDLLTEVNKKFPCLALPYVIRISQTRGYMPPGPCAKKIDPACHCNAKLVSRIPASGRGSISATSDSNRYD
ncbi:Uncharacterized protein Rs2_15868 [Raphanus sativus]|nr:Uncharacterized protein Rs2_15868 [Raphanus sativus]